MLKVANQVDIALLSHYATAMKKGYCYKMLED